MAARAQRKLEVRSQRSDGDGRKHKVEKIEQRSTLELDRLIHERLRLGIVSALAVNDRLTFNDLKRLL
ncbi:MAG: winged helix-turn-helix domain-containing protein, partial [Vicinamibacterales bacterium]